jgi:hypothetical protein
MAFVAVRAAPYALLFGWRRWGRLFELHGVNRYIRLRRSQQHV